MTEGSVLKKITLFALPCIASNALQNLYNILDSVIVGKAAGDVSELAAVGASGSLITLFLNTVTGLLTGFSVIVGRRFGSKDEKGVKRVYGNALFVSIVIGILISVLGAVFARKMLTLMDTPQSLMDSAVEYLRVIFLGMWTGILYNFFCEMLRAVGNGRMPLIFLLISFAVHIALIVPFLFVFKLGVIGAALSTVISQLTASLMCALYVWRRVPQFRLTFSDILPDFRVLRECVRIGIPMAVTNFVVIFGVIILSFITNGIGETYVVAYTCASRVGYIVTTPIFGFSTALSVFAAQNMGVGNIARIKAGIKKTLLLVSGVNVILLLLFCFISKPLLSYLLEGEELAVSAGVTYLLIRCLAMNVLTFASGFKSVLAALGKPMFPTVSGFIEVTVRYTVPITLSARLGFISVPLTDAIAWLVLAVFLTVGYVMEMKRLDAVSNKECVE